LNSFFELTDYEVDFVDDESQRKPKTAKNSSETFYQAKIQSVFLKANINIFQYVIFTIKTKIIYVSNSTWMKIAKNQDWVQRLRHSIYPRIFRLIRLEISSDAHFMVPFLVSAVSTASYIAKFDR
jgi:hypothetical protein